MKLSETHLKAILFHFVVSTFALTNYTEQGPSEADSHSASQEISRRL